MKRQDYRKIGYFFFAVSFYFLGLAAFHFSELFGGWNDRAFSDAIACLLLWLINVKIALTLFRQARKS